MKDENDEIANILDDIENEFKELDDILKEVDGFTLSDTLDEGLYGFNSRHGLYEQEENKYARSNSIMKNKSFAPGD